MFHAPRQLRRAAGHAAIIAILLAGLTGAAHADNRLAAHYVIKVAGVTIGQSELNASIGANQYTSAMKGQASGMLSILVSGEGSVSTQGSVADGRLVPASFTSSTTQDKEKAAVKMTIANGDVKDLSAETSAPNEDRVAVTADHKKGIVDPLTALLIRVDGDGDLVAAQTCQRKLPVFDGRRRFDLTLSFKRIDQVKADKGYTGPAVVCAIAFTPIAGHRPGSALLKYLTDGREIELAFAPIAGTRLLAPYRLSIASMLGNMVIEASEFTATTAAAALAPGK